MYKILLFLLLTNFLYAIPTITIDTQELKIDNFTLEYFTDNAENLTITDLKNSYFTNIAHSNISFKISNPVAWLRFNIHNNTNKSRIFYLHNHFGYLSTQLDFYEIDSKKISQELNIDFNNVADSQKKMYAADAIFNIYLEANQTKTIYIKSKMNDIHIMHYVLYDLQSSRKNLSSKNTYELIFVGIFIGLTLYYLILAIATRYKEYIYFILFLLSVTSWELQISGSLARSIGFYYNTDTIYFALILLAVPVFLMQFFKTILITKVKYPLLEKLFNSVIFLFLALLLLGIFSPQIAISLGTYLFIYMFIILFIASYILIKKADPLALYFLIGNSLFSILAFISDLFYLGYLRYNIFIFHAVNVGLLIEFVALGFMLSWKVRQYQSDETELSIQKELRIINEALEVKIEQELKLSQEKDKAMFAQRKMASMGEMIENIAHQWRQPLSEVNACVLAIDTIVYQQYKSDDAIEKELKNIENLTKYMSDTIDHFKNFFDNNKTKKYFKLEDLLNSSLLLLQNEFNKNSIEVIKDIRTNIQYKGYMDELQQVLLILFNNARDVFLARNIQNPTLVITISTTAKDILISIWDNGKGIDEDIIDKIFDPYFSTKHKAKGTGLGLYMSKVIIEDSMRGKISVKNSKVGACFSILLPIEKEL
ncbi:MAG: sensor histidine kinase [Sulfurimonas sp.]|nr:sensor histidine kinase [Sulfurimonas sp.]